MMNIRLSNDQTQLLAKQNISGIVHLTDLLDVIPRKIDGSFGGCYKFTMYADDNKWFVGFVDLKCVDSFLVSFTKTELIDALFDCFEWCIAHKIIKQ